MINSVVITGRFKRSKNNNELLLKIEGLENHQIVTIKTNSALSDKTKEYIMENDLVGIKGYIEINDDNNIVIIASKVTFLSGSKQKAQD
jgi:hypothetical protein